MSQKDETVKTQSDEAGSAVLSDTILESQLEEIKRDLRGKVSGKFLRLTMSDRGVPIFVRAEHIGAYHDLINEFKGFRGCWITGTGFGFSIKERAEDLQTLIGMVEDGPSAEALSQVLASIFVASGLAPAQAIGLLSDSRATEASQAITEVCERLTRAEAERPYVEKLYEALTLLLMGILGHPETQEAPADLHTLNAALPSAAQRVLELKRKAEAYDNDQPHRETLERKWRDVMTATEQLAEALGERSRFELDDDPVAATEFLIGEAIRRLGEHKTSHTALLDKGGRIRAMAVSEQVQKEKFLQLHQELMQAGDKVLQALDVEEFDEDSSLGPEDHAAMLRMLGRAVELIGGLKERADNAEIDANDLRKKLLRLQGDIEVLKQRLSVYEGQS